MRFARLLRDLRLNLKVTMTLTAVFVSIAAVFLCALFFVQRDRRARILGLKSDLIRTLHASFRADFVYGILQENEQSLAVDLADLADRVGVVAAWLEAPSMGFVATTDARVLVNGGGSLTEEAGKRDDRDTVLVFRLGKATRVFSASGRGREVSKPADLEVPAYFGMHLRNGVEFCEVDHFGLSTLSFRGVLEAAGDPYGTLFILFSLSDLERTESLATIIVYVLIITIFVLLLVLLNLLISRIVIRPVGHILAGMERASQGDLEHQLPVESKDEIGAISDSFNHMIRDLKASKDEIEEYSHNLERRVADRTRKLRLSEENLLNLKNYLATVIANVETGVISVDQSGRVTTFNERAAQILDVSAEDAEGRTLSELLTGGEAGRLVEFLAPVLAGDKSETRGQLNLRLPERRRTLSVVASTLFGERRSGGADGRVRLGTVVVFEDVTQLISSQRLGAWKEAVEKVIHEIKNPLTPISLAAQRIRSAYLEKNENFEEIFLWGSKTILDSVTSLKDLITEFSRFYRLPRVVLRTTSVNRLVEEMLALYRSQDVNRLTDKVSLELDLSENLPEVEADAEQLKRVLLNVVKNSIESIGSRSGRVEVATHSTRVGGGEVCISIRDDGAGIEDVEKIFEPYYTTKVKGTGLGLIISRQILEEHGGEIRVRSEVGKGTEVDILLPSLGSSGPTQEETKETESLS